MFVSCAVLDSTFSSPVSPDSLVQASKNFRARTPVLPISLFKRFWLAANCKAASTLFFDKSISQISSAEFLSLTNMSMANCPADG